MARLKMINNQHPRDYLEPDEYSKLLSQVIDMQKQFWKNAPRVVYDHKNNDINVRCGDTLIWGNKNAK